MKLICFTYAGGTGDFFQILEPELGGEIQLVCPDYAGHGKRRKEPFYRDFDQLADDLYQAVCAETSDGSDYSLLGYSMGSISAAEMLKRIIAKDEIPLPKHIFLFAHEPHTKLELSGYSSGELDDLVKERTIRFGGLPESMINNPVFWRMQLPLFRADYGLIGDYDFNSLNLKTNIPATVFYSETDTPLSEMLAWKNYFIGECEFKCYSGNHFFIREHVGEIASVIRNLKINNSQWKRNYIS